MNAGTLGSRRDAGQALLSRASFLIEAACVVTLAYVLAALLWTIVAPGSLDIGVSASSPAADPARAPALAYRPQSDGVNIFRPAQMASAEETAVEEAAPMSTLNLTVSGARLSSREGEGSAIILTPDGAQRVYAVGDEIIDGVELYRVERDRVLVRRQGLVEALPFATRELTVLGGAQSDASVGADDPKTVISGAALLGSVAARPSPEDEDLVALYPRGDGAAFAEAGFEAGDVALSVNGRTVSEPGTLREALERVAVGSLVEVRVRRDGAERTISFEVG